MPREKITVRSLEQIRAIINTRTQQQIDLINSDRCPISRLEFHKGIAIGLIIATNKLLEMELEPEQNDGKKTRTG